MTANTENKKLIQSQDERGLLASVIVAEGNSIFDECISNGIDENCFLDPFNKVVWQAMGQIAERLDVIDEVSISRQLENVKDSCVRVSEIAGVVDTSLHWRTYANRLLEENQRRAVKRAFQKFNENAQALEHKENLANLESEILGISRSGADVEDLSAQLNSFNAELAKRIKNRGRNGFKVGYDVIDRLKLEASNFAVLAGRCGTGKTAFMLNIVERNLKNPKPLSVLIFTLEMKASELITRFISSMAEVRSDNIRDGLVSKEQLNAITDARNFLSTQNKNLHIVDSGNMTIQKILSTARQHKNKYGIGLICIDYLQLIKCKYSKSREQEVSEASRCLKELAKEIDCIVLCLAQLNRECEKSDRLPRISDLRESGAIEQDADCVILLARDGLDSVAEKVNVKAIVGKSRHSSIFSTDMTFNKAFTRFEDLTPTKGVN